MPTDAVVFTAVVVARTEVAVVSVAAEEVLSVSVAEYSTAELVVSAVVLASVEVDTTEEAVDDGSVVVLAAVLLPDALAAAQISPVIVNVFEASEDEHLLRTHEVAAAVIFDWLSLVHWQAVSVIPQVVADVMALWIQG